MEPWLGNPGATLGVIKKYGIRLRKRYGQNFLIDSRVLDGIITSAGVTKEDFVLEIGPGIGTLTQYLCAAAKKVLAVEIDRDLIRILSDTLQGFENVSVLNRDILKTDLQQIAEEENEGRPLKVVANLPYYITTPIIMGIIESPAPVESMTFMVQKEVAERMIAAPGGKDYGALSLAVQYRCDAHIDLEVPPDCFIPKPEVTSSVITLQKKEERIPVKDEQKMFALIRAAFSTRRKTLVNCLGQAKEAGLDKEKARQLLMKMGLAENIRGEQLSLEQFARLSDMIS